MRVELWGENPALIRRGKVETIIYCRMRRLGKRSPGYAQQLASYIQRSWRGTTNTPDVLIVLGYLTALWQDIYHKKPR